MTCWKYSSSQKSRSKTSAFLLGLEMQLQSIVVDIQHWLMIEANRRHDQ